jgi:hypothetical protein
MMDDGHRALKRFERARQLAGVRADPELRGPLAQCRIRGPEGTPGTIPVYVVALFAGGFAYVKAAHEPVPQGVPATAWMVRGGIRMDAWLRDCVRHWRAGLRVPAPMSPVRKLPSALLVKLEELPDSALAEVFAKLRETGLLPVWPAVTRETCPPGLVWDGLRARFQDFAGEGLSALTDNPPR